MYKKIVVGYDGSEKSQAALDHAADIADYHHALLIIIHVMKEKPPVSSQPLYPSAATRIEADERMDILLQEKEEEELVLQSGKGRFLVRKARNRLYLEDEQIQTEVLFGDPAKEITRLAQIENADLIVLGNRGLNGLKKIMLGSVSQKVAQSSECPVLIVK